MKIQGKLVNEIIDKQFEMIGVNLKFADIPEDEMVGEGKKRMKWYEQYKFTEEQEKQWKDWIEKINKGRLSPKELVYIELRYGFVLDYKKKGAE